jgi:tRNA A-37 threonylcarbamoyl transferase component Bud32
MSLPIVAPLSPEDVDVIARSQFWHTERLHVFELSSRKVLVKAQRQQRHPFRYALMNMLASVLKLPMIKAAPAPGGADAQGIEVLRLRALRQAGVHVPAVLHAAPEWFAMEYVNAPNLLDVLQSAMPMQERLSIWLKGAKGIGYVHVRGQALSQAFARNCLWSEDQTWFIDFEDDPASVMPIEHAQARDGLAYLHSTVWALREQGASWSDLLSNYEPLAQIFSRQVAEIILKTSSRITWLRHLPQSRKPWGRDVVMLQALGEFLYLAQQRKRN